MIEHKSELCDIYMCSEDAIVLEPWDTYKRGIVGFTEGPDGGNILVYSYSKIVEAIAEDSMKNNEYETFEEAYEAATEWVDYNTMRSLPYMDKDFRPIIMYEVED